MKNYNFISYKLNDKLNDRISKFETQKFKELSKNFNHHVVIFSKFFSRGLKYKLYICFYHAF